MENFVFVDESGDFGQLGTKYFVIVAVQVSDEKLLGRIVKRVRERKLKKKWSAVPELKGFNSSPEIRRFVLEKIAKLESCRIYLLAVEKKKVFPQLLASQNKLYNWLCRLLCQQIPTGKVRIVMDKKYNNRLLRKDFDSYLSRESALRGIEAKIEHLESHSCPPLQAIDFVAWAANRKYSHGEETYYKIIEGKIANKENELLWS